MLNTFTSEDQILYMRQNTEEIWSESPMSLEIKHSAPSMVVSNAAVCLVGKQKIVGRV